ncbi:MAG: hypothetical protein KAS72_03070 [Phycisphaerales bacterium]|nr:hypothetical protein [Phycisphaerales bacterium]
MSVNVGRTKLQDSYKDLQAKWSHTRAVWRDVARDEFEKQYLAPLEPRISASLTAMTRMAELLARLRRECD